MNALGTMAATVLLATGLMGCASSGGIANQIVKSNLAQETAENQLLVLNILRAYERRPIYFTQTTAVHLPLGVGNPGFVFSLPFGGDPKGNILTSSLSVPQSMDVAFQNTQEFMRGITRPLPSSLMTYYIDQGWPSEMVLMLFVGEIRRHDSQDAPPVTFTNRPANPQKFDEFHQLISQMANCDFQIVNDKPRAYGPSLAESDLTDIKALVAARSAGLVIESAHGQDGRLQLALPSSRNHIELKARSERGPGDAGGQEPPDALTCTMDVRRISTGDPDSRESGEFERHYELVLRSPEAILYYLGEIARAELGDPAVETDETNLVTPRFPTIRYHERDPVTKEIRSARLFTVSRGSPDKSFVTVNYDGQTFSIPGNTRHDQSSHVLSLVSQILALQNKASDLPGATSVHVVP